MFFRLFGVSSFVLLLIACEVVSVGGYRPKAEGADGIGGSAWGAVDWNNTSVMSADTVFVCSDLEGVDIKRLEGFVSSVKVDGRRPVFLPGNGGGDTTGKRKVLFVASNGVNSPDIEACIRRFSFVSSDLYDAYKEHASKIGIKPEFLVGDLKYPDRFAALSSGWFVRSEGDWLLVSFQSVERPQSRLVHALTGLFGYDDNVCKDNKVCFLSDK